MNTSDNGSDNGFGSQATAYFKSPTTRKKGYITIESRPFKYDYGLVNTIHNAVLNYVRDPDTGEGINGFQRIGFQGRSATKGFEKYGKEVTEDELDEFKKLIYSMPASASLINLNQTKTVDDYVNSLITDMERTYIKGGKRTKRRRGKNSRKGKSKKRYSRRR